MVDGVPEMKNDPDDTALELPNLRSGSTALMSGALGSIGMSLVALLLLGSL